MKKARIKTEEKEIMKTITLSEIQKLLKEGFSVKRQSNDLVFVGKKSEPLTTSKGDIKHGVSQEEVFRLVPEKM